MPMQVAKPKEKAARYVVINGYRWDRYNVGVTNLIPALNDPDGLSAENQGAKYMFGAGQMNPIIISLRRRIKPPGESRHGSGAPKTDGTRVLILMLTR